MSKNAVISAAFCGRGEIISEENSKIVADILIGTDDMLDQQTGF